MHRLPGRSEQQNSPPRTLCCPEPLICCTLLRPHRQERTDRGKGKRRRRSNKTRNCSASNRVTRFVGTAVKGTDDKGPLSDLTIALSAGVSLATQRVIDGGTALKQIRASAIDVPEKVPSPLPNLLLVGHLLPMLPMLATALQRLGNVLRSPRLLKNNRTLFLVFL